ncbi:MAG: 50S ribosomal protein L22 [bacterium]|nr:50S ribosomal protein L22 [bacterium]
MEISAESKYLRIAPRKVALVAKAVRGLSPQAALSRLQFTTKAAAYPLVKVIKSAIANAQNNAKLTPDSLRIKSLEVLAGSSLKRWHPVSRGRAHPYKRRTTHIRVILEGKT